MKNNLESKRNKRMPRVLVRTSLFLALFFFSFYALTTEAYTIGPNYKNISVDTRANITNAGPEVLSIVMEDPITLTAGFTQEVSCNVSLRDYNGFADIDTVNGTFFHSSSSVGAVDDNNTHYTNTSCSTTGESGIFANYTCTTELYYYAEPLTWNCTVFVNDTFGFGANDTTNATVNSLFALNLTNPIDYGDLAIFDTSPNMTANVTNFGNVPINVSVYGYGNTSGDGLAMDCAQGNITIDNEKYSADINDNFAAKIALTGSGVQIPTLTVSKQTVPAAPTVNVTYWQLYVPPNPFGVCNGTVVFQAESSI